MPDLPQSVKMAYLHCPVREYIPNPLRCFNCQPYGHSKNVCQVQPTCPRFGETGHDTNDCMDEDMLELHPLYDDDFMDMLPGPSIPTSERGASST
ncbi:hypothetical protein TNCV_4718921 [Trichonephila clavipes]|nr:hypothetical protein TNCV_4718921 [Trichonephila clavipes]